MAQEIYREPFERRTTTVRYATFLRNFADTQLGPIYLGMWGALAICSFTLCVFLIFMGYGHAVGYNPIRFMREFGVLSVEPPAASMGLQWAPLQQGGFWQLATLFLCLTLTFWTLRMWTRASAWNLRPTVAVLWGSVLFLFASIYIIHPIWVGSWNEAPGHGLRAQLVWANAFSIKYGNFYYNPFHMVSIFGLLGSTVLVAMHGATILATLKYGSHHEAEEVVDSDEGTHRSQLFWRWIMGFNATAWSIHVWAAYFGAITMIFGAIGVLACGTAEPNWFLWACRAGIVPGGQAACTSPY